MEKAKIFKNYNKIDLKFSRQRCLDPGSGLEKTWIRIRFALKGWIRNRIRSISDRIRNPGQKEGRKGLTDKAVIGQKLSW